MRSATLAVVAIFCLTASGQADAGDPRAGKKVWEGNACPSCHGVDGRPVVPQVPDFSRGERMLKPDSQLVGTIARGAGIMPAWRGILKHQAMIDVVVYIRTLRKR